MVQKGMESPVAAPMVRSAAMVNESGLIIVGTAACDIWELCSDDSARVLLFGHHDHVIGLAANPNPSYAHVFATCSNSNKIGLWSIATNKVLTVLCDVTGIETVDQFLCDCPALTCVAFPLKRAKE